MKTSRDTTMPQVPSRISEVPEEHLFIYSQLIELLKPYSYRLEVKRNSIYQYELWTEHEHRPKSFHVRRKYGVLFAGISICKPHVGFYFYPLHLHDDLREKLPEELKLLQKGRSVFHFKDFNPVIANLLKELIDEGFHLFQQKGWIIKGN